MELDPILLNSNRKILLEICDKLTNEFLGVVSLPTINYQRRSAQIATLSPITKKVKNRYCVYEARRANIFIDLTNLIVSSFTIKEVF